MRGIYTAVRYILRYPEHTLILFFIPLLFSLLILLGYHPSSGTVLSVHPVLALPLLLYIPFLSLFILLMSRDMSAFLGHIYEEDDIPRRFLLLSLYFLVSSLITLVNPLLGLLWFVLTLMLPASIAVDGKIDLSYPLPMLVESLFLLISIIILSYVVELYLWPLGYVVSVLLSSVVLPALLYTLTLYYYFSSLPLVRKHLE